jgi:hypothetical protein
MKTIIIASMLLVAASAYGGSFRCGSDIIREGYDSFTVLRRCGEPVHKEVIGYKLSGDRSREAKIERWVYGPDDGYYTLVRIEGGVVKKIEFVRD